MASGAHDGETFSASPHFPAHVLCWHGRGAIESAAFDPLRQGLSRLGIASSAIDWDARDDLAPVVLRESLQSAARHAGRVIVVGWSLGGTAALSMAADPPAALAGVITVAADVCAVDPLTGRSLEVRPPRVQVRMIHGTLDAVAPIDLARAWARRHPQVRFLELPTDHAGVLGLSYDPDERRCVPSTETQALQGLAVVIHEVREIAAPDH